MWDQTPASSAGLRFDTEERIIPSKLREITAELAVLERVFREMAAIPDESNEDDCDSFRAMDAARPDCPPFAWMY